MNVNPMFSIIVPVYNVEKYLGRCIDSLLKQTFDNIEILLIDDGSKDASGEICEFYGEKFKNITVYHKENGGLASARNEGLRHVKGQYISFIDSDDWVAENTYEIIYNGIKGNASIDILNFGYQKILNDTVIFQEHCEFPQGFYNEKKVKELILPDSIARKRAFNQVNLPVQLSSCMCVYRKDFLIENNLIFESERLVLNEDWLFNISCLCRAKQIVVLHDYLYYYDTRADSLSYSYKPDAYERKQELYRRYQDEVIKTGNFNSDTEHRLQNFWLESIYCCFIIELNKKKWNKQSRLKMKEIANDENFKQIFAEMKWSDCTLKGWAFWLVIKLRLFYFVRIIYKAKRLLHK